MSAASVFLFGCGATMLAFATTLGMPATGVARDRRMNCRDRRGFKRSLMSQLVSKNFKTNQGTIAQAWRT